MKKKLDKNKNPYVKGIIGYSSLGIEISLSIVLGYLIGNWVDSKIGTYPLFLIIFIAAGLTSSVKRIYVISKKYLNDNNEEQQKKQDKKND